MIHFVEIRSTPYSTDQKRNRKWKRSRVTEERGRKGENFATVESTKLSCSLVLLLFCSLTLDM